MRGVRGRSAEGPLTRLAALATLTLSATPAAAQMKPKSATAKHETEAQLQAEAKNAKIDMAYIPAADVSKAFDEMMNQPPNVLEAMNKYLKLEE